MKTTARKFIISAFLAIATSTAAFSGDPQVGIYVRTAGGKVIEDINGNTNFTPASNMKLISTGTALKKAGSAFQFKTALAYSGTVREDGCLDGDLYIIGGGDPTLGSSSRISLSPASLFSEWHDALRRAGIRKISGSIIADTRCLTDDSPHGSWMAEDLGTYYGVTPNGLDFYENAFDFTVTPGAAAGDDVTIVQKYPSTPWLILQNSCTTGKEGSGDKTWLYSSKLSGVGRFTGTYAKGKPASKVSFSNPYPEFSCAWEFCDFLRRNGIFCSSVTATSDCHPVCIFENGVPDFRFLSFEDGDGLTAEGIIPRDSLSIIYTTSSAPLAIIAKETNFHSNNLYAETLFMLCPYPANAAGDAKHNSNSHTDDSTASRSDKVNTNAGKTYSYYSVDRAVEAERQILRGMGLSIGSIFIDDGSGLSRKNSISPKFFCDFLAAMSKEKCFKDYLASIASPSTDSSTKALLPLLSEQPYASRVHLKSGSMKGVMCYSGYMLPATEDGEIIVFSIMLNNGTESSSRLRKTVEKKLVEVLSTCRN